MKYAGVSAQITSSTSWRNSSHVSGAAVGTVASIRVLASRQFLLLSAGDDLHDSRIQPPSDLFAENADTAAGDGAKGQLGLAGHTELAYDEHVERSAERRGDLVGDRHSATREAEHEDVGPPGQVAQGAGQPSTGLGPVPECARHGKREKPTRCHRCRASPARRLHPTDLLTPDRIFEQTRMSRSAQRWARHRLPADRRLAVL